MADGSDNDITAAGYQPDGSSAQQPTVQNDTGDDGSETDDAPPTKNENEKADVKDDGAEGDDQHGSGNPLTALVQTRQQARDNTSQYESTIARLQQDIADLKAAKAAPEAKPEKWSNPYDAVEQPVDHLRAELEHTRAEMNQLREDGERELAEDRSVRALADFEANVAQDIADEATRTPVILDAYKHINDRITGMHRGQGLKGRRLSQAVRNSILQGFVNGQTNGMSHAQTAASMALELGFEDRGTKAPKADPVKRGQKAKGQSLGDAAGQGGSTTPPSAKQLTQMSKADLKKDGGAGIQRIRDILQGKVPLE